MKVVSAAEMRQIDATTIEQYHITGQMLMAYAGKAAAERIMKLYGREKRIGIYCGKGNNGGDGFVIATLLHAQGYGCQVYCTVHDKTMLSDEAAVYYGLCEKLGLLLSQEPDPASYDLIVDCLLGTGVNGILKGELAALVQAINGSEKPVLSIDMPSGLPSEGSVDERAIIVKATHTITIGLPKVNLCIYPGMRFAGIVDVADIGFPQALLESSSLRTSLLSATLCSNLYQTEKNPDTYKGERGHLLIVGGFATMEGAALMAARAALETGVGLLTLVTSEGSRPVIAGKIPEAMTRGLQQHSYESEISEILKKSYQTIVIGPGMGRDLFAQKIFAALMRLLEDYQDVPVVIDGDGLFLLAEYCKQHVLSEKLQFILTPHFGEAARLLETSSSVVSHDRFGSVRQLAKKIAGVALLKGPRTLISDGNNTYINTTGSPALATGGSGDVLSGILGALLLSHDTLLEATSLAAYIHGRAADLAVARSQVKIMKATDTLSYVRSVLRELEENRSII